MQQNRKRGRPRTGKTYLRTTLSYPKDLKPILKQVKEWDSKVNFSDEFVKAIKLLHEKLARLKKVQ